MASFVGSLPIRKIDKINLTYIDPNRIIIKNTTFLIFNYSNATFIENLSNKIKLSKLGDYWRVSKDMYEHGIFSDDTIESIKDDYFWNKENDEHKDKGRDNFEL